MKKTSAQELFFISSPTEPLLRHAALKALQLSGMIERTQRGMRQRRMSGGYQGAGENA